MSTVELRPDLNTWNGDERRYPLLELLLTIRKKNGDNSMEGFAERLGTTVDSLTYYAEVGLPADKADEYAVAAGWHPGLIWLEWWEHPIFSEEEMEWLDETKFCWSCQQRHSLLLFGAKTGAGDGYQSSCRRKVNKSLRCARQMQRHQRRLEAAVKEGIVEQSLFEL